MSFFLKKKFDQTKCKILLQLTIQRIKILRNKDIISITKSRGEIARLIESGQANNAAVETLLRQANIVAAYDLIEQFCEVVINHLAIIKSQKGFPADSKEAIASLIYAADCCSELQELQKLKKIFVSKYGSDFYIAVKDQKPCGLNLQIITKLAMQPPSDATKMKLLKEIADEHNIKWNYEEPTVDVPKSEADLINSSFPHLASATEISEVDKIAEQKPVPVTSPEVKFASLGDDAKACFEQDMPTVNLRKQMTTLSIQRRKRLEYKPEDVAAAAEFAFLCATQAAEAAKVTVNMIKVNSHKKITDVSSQREGVQQANANKDVGYGTAKSRTVKIYSMQDKMGDVAEIAHSDTHEDIRELPYFDKNVVVADRPHFEKYEDIFEMPLFDEHEDVSEVVHFDKHEHLSERLYSGKHEVVSETVRFEKENDASKIVQLEDHDAISENPYIDNHKDAFEMQQPHVCVHDKCSTNAYFSTHVKAGEYVGSFKELENCGSHAKFSNLQSEELQKGSYYQHDMIADEEKYSVRFDNSAEQVDFPSQSSPLSDVRASFKMGGARYRKSMSHKKLEWHSKHNTKSFNSAGPNDTTSAFEPSNFVSRDLCAVSEEHIGPFNDLSIWTGKPNWQINLTPSEGSDSISPSYQEQIFTPRALDTKTFDIESSPTNGRSVRSIRTRKHQDIHSPISIEYNPLQGR